MIIRRTKGKLHSDYGIRQIKKWYIKTLPEKFVKNKREIRKNYNKVIREFNKEIIDLLIKESFEFIMPDRLGTLRIKKKKIKIKLKSDGTLDTKNLTVDWKATKEKKKIIYHTNSHTDGCRFVYFWNKRGSNIKNHTIYCFKPARLNSRLLAKEIKNNNKINFYE